MSKKQLTPLPLPQASPGRQVSPRLAQTFHCSKKPKIKPMTDANGFKVKPRSSANDFDNITYRIDGKLRKVDPYYFIYKTYCKQRWQERNILEVFTTEFRDKPASYYKWAIENGQVSITTNFKNKPKETILATIDTTLHDGDLICHRTHKHEPPVSAQDPQIIFMNQHIVVVNKPSGMPVHPTGRYKYNTVVNLLKYQHDGLVAHPCNRLDRLTSGLMFLAKTPVGSQIMFEQLTKRNVEKFYIAKVKGNFPLRGDLESSENLSNEKSALSRNGKIHRHSITVDKPLETISPQLGLNKIADSDNPQGKEATTVFTKISYDAVTDTSIVKCQPLTGRTHQIRVHLQYLGHPIANDPIYSNIDVWGADLGAENKADYKDIMEKLNRVGKQEPSSSWFYQMGKHKLEQKREKELKSKESKKEGYEEEEEEEEQEQEIKGEVFLGQQCDVCRTELYTDSNPNDLEIWLHAYKYQTKNYDEEMEKYRDMKSNEKDAEQKIVNDIEKERENKAERSQVEGENGSETNDNDDGHKHVAHNIKEDEKEDGKIDNKESNQSKTTKTTKKIQKKSTKNAPITAADMQIGKVATEYTTIDDNFQRWSFKTPLPSWALAPQHTHYMKLAIKEAAKCGPITTAFSVGAVLVDSNNDKVLATGYSREIEGNTHAEQNALTKYYKSISANTNNSGSDTPTSLSLPKGTVIYTTMEPCSFRLSGNLPCADRIVATEGQILSCFVGVMEPKTFVQNNVGQAKLTSSGVEYIHVPGYEKEILEIAFKGHENK